MTYGPFSLSDATAAEFSLNLWLQSEFDYDGACAFASVDNFNFNGTCFTGTTSGVYMPLTLDLARGDAGNLLGQPNVWVAVYFESDGSITLPEGAYVDDLLLRKCTTGNCPAQQNPTLNGSARLRFSNRTIRRADSASPARP
jgi:hypothetical protein